MIDARIANAMVKPGETLDGLVAKNARYQGRDIAYRDMAGAVDWVTFDAMVSACACRLASAGVVPGDRVGFWIDSSISAYAAMFGAMRAGAMIVPFSTMLSKANLELLAASAECRLTVVKNDEFAPLPVVMEPGAVIDLADLPKEGGDDFVSRSRPELPASIIYSSGTTGLPKGAVHSHSARTLTALIAAFGFKYGPTSKTLLTTPAYTNGSWMMVLPALISGSETILVPGFDRQLTTELIARHHPTHAFIVPTQFQALLAMESYSPELFASFKCLVTAGTPMPEQLKTRLLIEVPGRLYELWGLTEVVATVNPPEGLAAFPDSVGRPLPLSEIRLINEQGAELELPATGEIVARSHYQMLGYWDQPALNEAIKWQDAAGESFMRTGDLGEIDDQGRLYIRGRIKDLIISGGLNVYPSDIEEVLRTHHDVEDAAVIGVPHEKWGETPVGYLRLARCTSIDIEDIRIWANERLAKFQRLHQVIAVEDDFPRNTLGKVLKGDLRERYRMEFSASEEKLT